MRTIATLLCCLVVSSTSAQRSYQNNDKRFAGLDTAFARVLKYWHAAGFAVAVVEKNKVIYENGFGYRDVEKDWLAALPKVRFPNKELIQNV